MEKIDIWIEIMFDYNLITNLSICIQRKYSTLIDLIRERLTEKQLFRELTLAVNTDMIEHIVIILSVITVTDDVVRLILDKTNHELVINALLAKYQPTADDLRQAFVDDYIHNFKAIANLCIDDETLTEILDSAIATNNAFEFIMAIFNVIPSHIIQRRLSKAKYLPKLFGLYLNHPRIDMIDVLEKNIGSDDRIISTILHHPRMNNVELDQYLTKVRGRTRDVILRLR
jgi:hypothetical protein